MHLEQCTGASRKVHRTAELELRPGLGKLTEYFNLMQKTARLDPVTGLNNRVIFEDRLAQAIREGKRSGRKYALVLIDLQGLDDLVQQRGQYVVDSLYCGKWLTGLRESLRESDHLARFERNLFRPVAGSFSSVTSCTDLVEKLYLSLIRRYRVYRARVRTRMPSSVSAVYPDHAVDADEFICAGEYRAGGGRTQCLADRVLTTKAMMKPIPPGFTIIQSLRRAIEHDELKLVYPAGRRYAKLPDRLPRIAAALEGSRAPRCVD